MVMFHHPYCNSVASVSLSTMAAFIADGYIVTGPTFVSGAANTGWCNAITSNNGAPAGLIARKR